MRKASLAGVFVLMLGLVAATSAAGPELSVGASCDTDRIGGGATVTVPITFHAGDMGQPTGVSAIDFAVTFAPDAFTVTDVRPPAALASSGNWTFDWEGTLGLPETPGRVGIAIAPEFKLPLPTLPDGPIAELVLAATAPGQSRCIPITIPSDSVVLSTPPLGLEIPPGAVSGGGVAVAELCGDCADNDGDGLIDLADPDCGAQPISAAQVMVKRSRRGNASPSVRGTIAAPLEELAGPVRLSLRLEGVEPSTCFAVDAQVSARKGKKNRRVYKLTIGGKKVATLVSNLKKSRTTMAGKLPGLALPPDASALSMSLWLDKEPFYASIPRKRSGKKGEVYR